MAVLKPIYSNAEAFFEVFDAEPLADDRGAPFTPMQIRIRTTLDGTLQNIKVYGSPIQARPTLSYSVRLFIDLSEAPEWVQAAYQEMKARFSNGAA